MEDDQNGRRPKWKMHSLTISIIFSQDLPILFLYYNITCPTNNCSIWLLTLPNAIYIMLEGWIMYQEHFYSDFSNLCPFELLSYYHTISVYLKRIILKNFASSITAFIFTIIANLVWKSNNLVNANF